MLFSGKKNVFKLFGCLKIRFTENQFRCLVRSNIFTENALHSQATQFSIHFLNCKHVDNESITHSFTKETKPNKKRKSNPVNLRSRGGGEGEIRGEIGMEARSSGEIGGEVEWRRDQVARCCDRRSAQCDHQTGARSVVAGEVSSSSLFAMWALSLFCSRGFFLSVALSLFCACYGKCLKVKRLCKMISGSTSANFGQMEIIFLKIYFP